MIATNRIEMVTSLFPILRPKYPHIVRAGKNKQRQKSAAAQTTPYKSLQRSLDRVNLSPVKRFVLRRLPSRREK